jgi:hypothetical protein
VMLEGFAEDARRVLVLASRECRRWGHAALDVGHVALVARWCGDDLGLSLGAAAAVRTAAKNHLAGQHVDRHHTGVMLTLYQLLCTAMVEAIETRPGLDPDRASFTTALQTARDQLVTAAGVLPIADLPVDDRPADLADDEAGRAQSRLGLIGTAVLATLLPARRPRYSNRNVKCSTSRYHARDDGRPALPTAIVAIDITVRTPPINLTPTRRPPARQRHRHPHGPTTPSAPRPPTRRERVTAILLSEPRHDWHGWELAQRLQITQHNLLTQLSEWARLGFIERTGKGTYALDRPPPG